MAWPFVLCECHTVTSDTFRRKCGVIAFRQPLTKPAQSTTRRFLVVSFGGHLLSPDVSHTFFKEKNFENRVYAFEFNGMHHTITTDVVIAAIHKTEGTERERSTSCSGVHNGDFTTFRALRQGLAARYPGY